MSSMSESVETKNKQDAGNGSLGSTSFGSSSAAVASTWSDIFGFSSSAMTASNSQPQGSVFGTASGSTPSTLAPSSTTSGFAISTQSQSVIFRLSASSPIPHCLGCPKTHLFLEGVHYFHIQALLQIFSTWKCSH